MKHTNIISDSPGNLALGAITTYHSLQRGSRLLQYATGTPDREVIIEVVKISCCDNTHQLNNKKDIAQLYSTVVESNHYHRHPSTRKDKDYQRSDLRETKGTMKENILSFNQQRV